MFLCLSTEAEVKTGGQQASWKGWRLAVSQGKIDLSSSMDHYRLGIFA